MMLAVAQPGVASNLTQPAPPVLLDERVLAPLMQECHIDAEVRAFAQQSQAGMMSELRDSGQTYLLEKGKGLSQSMFSEGRVLKLFRTRLQAGLDPQSAGTELAFCRSALGQKVLGLLEQFGQGDEVMAKFAKRYEAGPAPANRISWATRVDNAIAGSRAMVDVQQAVVGGILLGMNQVLAPEARKSKNDIAFILSGMHIQTEKIARNAAIAGFMATFDDLSDDEFAAYAQHLISPSGSLLYHLKFQSYIEFANSAAGEMGEAIAQVDVPK
ncbi:hypothetical protein [Duganella vulcania]|uniref:DUF2059 domain-containing protein n=1 Tax=Duganella vulcania TaxID=2692166 RepID=A0A845GDU2_9BURK|nr:hypothetical protein [Duganella vulcania]MYM92793.1 hypothetical protein [Duganella vulcania]